MVKRQKKGKDKDKDKNRDKADSILALQRQKVARWRVIAQSETQLLPRQQVMNILSSSFIHPVRLNIKTLDYFVFSKKLWLAKTCTRDPQFRPGGFKVLKSLPKFLFHQKRNLWIYKNCKGVEPSNHAMWLQNFEFLLLPKLNFIRKEIELLKSAGPRY